MTGLAIVLQNISFAYDGATHPLFRNLTAHFPAGWTGVVGANGVGKSTLLRLTAGELKPQQGCLTLPPIRAYCEQRTDRVPHDLDELIHSLNGDAFHIKGRLGVEQDWVKRWHTLSHGERKRAQIAVALWRKPQVLAVDEPTNHLDTEAQSLIHAALSDFKGVGLLVSHDRHLLDDLCHQCLFLEPPDAIMRPGGYTHGLLQAQRDQKTAEKQRRLARQTITRLKRETTKRRDAASQANRKRSKSGLASKDHDTREKINLARLSGKDGSAGKRLNQLGGRFTQAQKRLDGIRVKKTYETGIWMPGTQSKRDTLFVLPAGSLPLGDGRRLHYPDLSMRPDDRIALTGPNGSGKSTLMNYILRSLNLNDDLVTHLPQELDAIASQDIMARAKVLPHEVLGRMMTIVSRLGSRPNRLLESRLPSPGEIRKVLLATGIARSPHLILMDEPTNHLDLPSIECLEQALSDCPCGLLLISHDRRFLNAVARMRWRISTGEMGHRDCYLKTE